MALQTSPIRWLIPVLLVLLVLTMTPGCLCGFDDTAVKEKVGKPAYNFTIVDIDGDPFVLSDMNGSIVLLDFMTLSCGPCEDQLSGLKNIFRDYPELRILTVSVDNQDSISDLIVYRDKHGLRWPVARDDAEDLEKEYAVDAVPTLYLIDRDQTIAWAKVGLTDEKDLRKEINKIL
jgi:peroxiredoxin